jgi:hypothetical protein
MGNVWRQRRGTGTLVALRRVSKLAWGGRQAAQSNQDRQRSGLRGPSFITLIY